MKKKLDVVITLSILVMLLINACTPAVNEPVDQPVSAIESPTLEEAATDAPVLVDPTQTNQPEDPGEVAPTEEVAHTQVPKKNTPAWFDFPLVDVRTGQTFTINDHHGKVVLVETLAMWCSSCLKQQMEVKQLHERLEGEDRFVSIGLDIDINEEADDLKAYSEKHQFDWRYVIAPVEVAREISTLYGAQFLNPPSTPILVIDKTGEVHLMNFGIKSADDLYAFLAPFLSQ